MWFTLVLLFPFAIQTRAWAARSVSSINQENGLNQTYSANLPTNWDLNCHEKKYVIGNQKVYWHQAFVLCQQNDMELASINSAEDQARIDSLLNLQTNMPRGVGKGYWISAVRMGACNSEFVHFTTGKPVVFSKWGGGQPDNTVEQCVEVVKESDNIYVWNDISCEGPYRLGYICQTKSCCAC